MTAKARVGIHVRLTPEVYERLRVAADERAVSVNWLAERAFVDFLDRLLPIHELRWTQ